MTDPDARFWDRAAPAYALSPLANVAAYERTLGRTLSYLRPGDRVLELGAGTSSTALRLAPHVADYTASDISAEMVRIGREKLALQPVPSLRIVQGVPGDPALGEGPFDAILALNLLHLLRDPAQQIRRIHGLLKPGGLFISKTGCLGGVFRAMMPVIGVMRLLGRAPHVTAFTVAQLERAITDAGFGIVEAATDPGFLPRRYIVARRL